MSRLAVIGLDAVEPQLVDELMRAGGLPRLRVLRERGVHFALASEHTWRAGRVWETFVTGVADFPNASRFDPRSYSCTQVGARERPPFFASIPDLTVVALDVPYLTLRHEVPGAQVVWSGHDTGYPRASRPAGLVREIDARFGAHPAFLNDFTCAWHHPPAIETLSEALLTGAHRRVSVAKWLLEREPGWDLFLTVLSEAHSAGEMFWHGVDPDHLYAGTPTAALAGRRLREIYDTLDTCVGELVDALPDDATILVTSVHGMQDNRDDVPSMALLPDLLYRDHFGKGRLHAFPLREQPALPLASQRWHEAVSERFDPRRSVLAKLELPPWRRELARSLRRERGRPVEALDQPIPEETQQSPEAIGEPTHDLEWQVASWYRDAWPLMRSFALPVYYDGRVRVNLRGRERDGIVDDYEAELGRVEVLLAGLENARTGKRAVRDLVRLRAEDPYDPAGPDADLVVTWEPGIDALQHPALGRVGPLPFRRTGGHTSRGFGTVVGPDLAPRDLGVQEAMDLTATLCALLGREAPAGVEGHAILRPRAPSQRAEVDDPES